MFCVCRDSLSNDKNREANSKSRSVSPRIPVWEADREAASTSQRPRPDYGDTSYPEPRRRYVEPDFKDERRNDDDRYPRHDKYPARESQGPRYDFNRYEPPSYETKWKEETFPPGRKRPYGNRGGYKGQGYRHDEHAQPSPTQDYDKDAADAYARSKVKLVDY